MPRRYCRWRLRVCFMLGRRPRWSCIHGDVMSSLQGYESRLFALVDRFLLRKRLRPSRPPAFFLPGACEEKAAGQRNSPLSDEWAHTSWAPCASLSPNREVTPILFFHPDQRPSAAASDLVSFGGSECDVMDDSMSLAASDAEEMSGSSHDPAPLPSEEPSATSTGMDAELFHVLSKAVEELGLEWSPPEEPTRSRLDEWFLPGCCQAPQQRASPFFTRPWRAPTRPAYVPSLRPPPHRSTAPKKKGTTDCLPWMSQLPHISARPRLSAGRQRPPTRPSRVGWLQLSLDEPIRQLDKRPQHFTPWPPVLSGQTPPLHGRVQTIPQSFYGAAHRNQPGFVCH